MSGQVVTQPKLIDANGDTVDAIDVEIEHTGTPSPESAAETLMRDFK